MSEQLYYMAIEISRGKLLPLQIWVMLAPGIIMGELTSDAELKKGIRKNTKPDEQKNSVEVAVKSISTQFTYKEISDDNPKVKEEKIITLQNATIYTNGVELHSLIASVTS